MIGWDDGEGWSKRKDKKAEGGAHDWKKDEEDKEEEEKEGIVKE